MYVDGFARDDCAHAPCCGPPGARSRGTPPWLQIWAPMIAAPSCSTLASWVFPSSLRWTASLRTAPTDENYVQDGFSWGPLRRALRLLRWAGAPLLNVGFLATQALEAIWLIFAPFVKQVHVVMPRCTRRSRATPWTKSSGAFGIPFELGLPASPALVPLPPSWTRRAGQRAGRRLDRRTHGSGDRGCQEEGGREEEGQENREAKIACETWEVRPTCSSASFTCSSASSRSRALRSRARRRLRGPVLYIVAVPCSWGARLPRLHWTGR